jgi:predicted AAA+ superfamily ATPase
MIKRKIQNALNKWKNEIGRRPLLIRGARQIGKTYIVNVFGKNEFDSFIILNFERNPEYKAIFSTYDPFEIIEKITLFINKKITQGKTLIFLDEIQECPEAIMSLRYFYEELPNLHIIGAGSLLEFALKSENFRMPVGRIQYLYMFPLSFGEFLNAMGQEHLYKYILKSSNLSELPDELHEKLIDLTRKYFILGGMPAVVNEYIQSKNILNCQRIQHSIVETFKDDFSKYARPLKFKYIEKVFAAVPARVGEKFVYSKVDKTIKSRDLKEAVELLVTAGLIYKVIRTSGAGIPLNVGTKDNFFKPIFLDVGLMHAVNGIYSNTIKEKELTAIYKGAVAEQFTGQEIIASHTPYIKPALYYWAREAKNSNAEIDYLIEKQSKIIPIEIKSGSIGRMKSMKMFLEIYKCDFGIKISQAPYKQYANIISIPFYAIEKFLNY